MISAYVKHYVFFWTFPRILTQRGVSDWKDMDRWEQRYGNEGSSCGRRVLGKKV